MPKHRSFWLVSTIQNELFESFADQVGFSALELDDANVATAVSTGTRI